MCGVSQSISSRGAGRRADGGDGCRGMLVAHCRVTVKTHKKIFTTRAPGSTVFIRSQPQYLVCASLGFTPELVW
jgi:hypothetical protein